jgi:hypothetical protein
MSSFFIFFSLLDRLLPVHVGPSSLIHPLRDTNFKKFGVHGSLVFVILPFIPVLPAPTYGRQAVTRNAA